MGARLLRGAGLAGNGVARNRRARSRTGVGDDALQHLKQGPVDTFREDASLLRRRRLLALHVVDEMRLHPHAAIRDRCVHRRELHRGHRDALTDRHVADRRARPVRGEDPRALAREVDPCLPAEAELLDPPLQARLAEERARDGDRADVGRALQDLRDGHRLGAARLGVVDAAVGDLDRVREGELRLRRDEVLGERARDRHDLEHRSGLEHVGHGVIALQALALGLREVVRVVARGLGHREHGPCLRVEHDRRPVLRAIPCDGLPQHLLRVRLDRVVERQEDGLSGQRRGRVLDADRAPERIAHDRLLAGATRELRVELGLETRKPDVVDAGVPEYLRRDRVLRIRAPLLAVEMEPGELLLREHARPGGRGLSIDVGEVRSRPAERSVDVLHLETEHARGDLCLLPWSRDRARIDIDGRRLLTKCERRAHAVEDGAACGMQDDRGLGLLLSRLGESRGAHRREPRRAREECAEREQDAEQEEADPRVDDPRHSLVPEVEVARVAGERGDEAEPPRRLLDPQRRARARELRGERRVLRLELDLLLVQPVEAHVQTEDCDVEGDDSGKQHRERRDPDDSPSEPSPLRALARTRTRSSLRGAPRDRRRNVGREPVECRH